MKSQRIARSYTARRVASPTAEGLFSYPCPKCRGKGKVPHYVGGKKEPRDCDRCHGAAQFATRYRSGIPAKGHHIYTTHVADLKPGADRWLGAEPSDRRAWVGGDRETFALFDTGDKWQPMVWRLPRRRGFLAGWHNEYCGTFCIDLERFEHERGSEEASEAPRDAIRRARHMAEQVAREEDEYLQANDYAHDEGRKAGAGGCGADDFARSSVSSDYREVWEEARAEAFADAARDAGHLDGRNGNASDAGEWGEEGAEPYAAGFEAGRGELREAANYH